MLDVKFDIGNLDRVITVNQLQKTTDTTGEKITTEVLYKNKYAYLNDVSGSEGEDGKVIALNVRKYTIRYDEYMFKNGPKMFIVDVDGAYNINSVELLGRKRFLILKCSKRE